MKTDVEPLGKYATAASRWAGVGPYYAMFPVTFACEIVRQHTNEGDVVLDPFAGRGTAVFAAASQNRIGLGIEINPVGWVYGKAKLQPASRTSVEKRLKAIATNAQLYSKEATALPEFFQRCFCRKVREFLLAARSELKWRRCKTDWTTAALLMVDLHGKRENALSNQMRQTKAMSPNYAIHWWNERDMSPPKLDPLAFMLNKVAWRYAKGRLGVSASRVYLGDSRERLSVMARSASRWRARLLFTSPPYRGVTNYFYDQWLRLWLLGGREAPRSPRQECKRKFDDRRQYTEMLQTVFLRSRPLLSRGAIIYIRTDARKFTLESTIEALGRVFPKKKLRKEIQSRPNINQTALFDSDIAPAGEVDLALW